MYNPGCRSTSSCLWQHELVLWHLQGVPAALCGSVLPRNLLRWSLSKAFSACSVTFLSLGGDGCRGAVVRANCVSYISSVSGWRWGRGRKWYFHNSGGQFSAHWRIRLERHQLHPQYRFPWLGKCCWQCLRPGFPRSGVAELELQYLSSIKKVQKNCIHDCKGFSLSTRYLYHIPPFPDAVEAIQP